MWNRLTSGAKFMIVLLLVGALAGGLYMFKPDLFSGKKGSSGNNSGGLFGGGNSSDADLTIGINCWSPYGALIRMNGGLEPNENSRMFKEYGIKLLIKKTDIFEDSRNQFKNGDLDLVYCTADVLPTETGTGSSMTESEAQLFLQTDWSRGGDAIVITKGINTVADLRGKTIALAQGTASHSLLIATLEANGMSMKDVNVKLVSNGIEAAQLFKANAVHAAVVWSPDDLDCTDPKTGVPGSKILTNTKSAMYIIADGVLAKKKLLDEKKDIVVKFATAWLVGNSEVATSEQAKREAAKFFAEAFNVDEAFALNGIENARLTTLGDNKNFFGLNPSYVGMTGEQLYSRMSIKYAEIGLAKNPNAWRNVSNTSIIEAIQLTSGQEPEAQKTFTPAKEEHKTAASIANKKISINFESGSYLLSEDAMFTIDREYANIAKTFTGARIRIEGNTDAVGNYQKNKELSLKRANAVANYLKKAYNLSGFIIIGNGPDQAIADGVKDENVNYRRTDFELVQE